MMSRKRERYMAPGTISEGTLRPEDLIPTYCEALRNVKLTNAQRNSVRAIETRCDRGTIGEYDLEDLQDVAFEYAPPYASVGSSDGDGALIGVWVDFDQLNAAVRDGEVIQSDQPPEGVQRADYWLHVNDHGNSTLYHYNGRRWVEVWAVV